MADFYRTENPEEMGEDEIHLYESLVGTTRYIKNYDDETDKETRKLYLKSILTRRELVVLYDAILDDTPVVAKVTIKYEIQDDIREITENVMYKLGINLEDLYNEEDDDYTLTDEQWESVYALRDEAIQKRKYTSYYIPEIRGESFTHKECYNYAIDHNITPRIHAYYGLFEDEKLPVIYYVMEKLGKNILESQVVPMETVAVDIIAALKVIHKAGYYHRDVTPMNILITTDGDAVNLIDFGIYVPTYAIESSRGIMHELLLGSDINKEEIKLEFGNPNFAPIISYLGGYNYAGDLEGLCYVLEGIYGDPYSLNWVPRHGKTIKEADAFKKKLNFKPTIPSVRELFSYIRSIENEMPDYEKCMDFFLKKE